jgi:Domain of unknown function (DUF4124)
VLEAFGDGGHDAVTSFCGPETLGLCFVTMHHRKSWLLLSLLAALSVQAGVIYKWTDADGVVHYSDQAQPGAEKIYTSSSSLNRADSGPSRPSTGNSQQQKPGGAVETQLTLLSPTPEQVFFSDETVGVRLDVQPTITPTQAITWHLNGKVLDQPPTATSFALQGLERGTYVLSATLVDQQTGDSVNSPTVTFYFRQPSALAPQHK